jgi:hypothetical protein
MCEFWLECLKGRNHSDDVNVNWIYMYQDRDWWWAPVKVVMNLVSVKGRAFLN